MAITCDNGSELFNATIDAPCPHLVQHHVGGMEGSGTNGRRDARIVSDNYYSWRGRTVARDDSKGVHLE